MVRSIPEFHVPANVAEARTIQTTLREQVKLTDDFAPILHIAGVDVGYDNARGLAHASVVVLKFDDLSVVEQIQAFAPAEFPYVPGFLSFREIPAILAALRQLNTWPQLFMVDGQGIAHPKRFGIAAHLGVLIDMPTIGVAKSRLVGSFDEVGSDKTDQVPLMDGTERIGTVLRSRDYVAPLFISPGHRVSIETATALTLRCLTRYRLPEPTRLADKFSKCKTNPFFISAALNQLTFDEVG